MYVNFRRKNAKKVENLLEPWKLMRMRVTAKKLRNKHLTRNSLFLGKLSFVWRVWAFCVGHYTVVKITLEFGLDFFGSIMFFEPGLLLIFLVRNDTLIIAIS